MSQTHREPQPQSHAMNMSIVWILKGIDGHRPNDGRRQSIPRVEHSIVKKMLASHCLETLPFEFELMSTQSTIWVQNEQMTHIHTERVMEGTKSHNEITASPSVGQCRESHDGQSLVVAWTQKTGGWTRSATLSTFEHVHIATQYRTFNGTGKLQDRPYILFIENSTRRRVTSAKCLLDEENGFLRLVHKVEVVI